MPRKLLLLQYLLDLQNFQEAFQLIFLLMKFSNFVPISFYLSEVFAFAPSSLAVKYNITRRHLQYY